MALSDSILDAITRRIWVDNITLLDALKRPLDRQGMIDSVPEERKLVYIEELAMQKGISFERANDILRVKPISPREMGRLFGEIANYLSNRFGMSTDYGMQLTPGLGTCFANVQKKTILVPNGIGAQAPFFISRAQAQDSQAEDSDLFALIKEARAAQDSQAEAHLSENARGLIDGFQGFIALHYCRERDNRVGRPFYSADVVETYSAGGAFEKAARGMDHFAGIYAVEGPRGVANAMRHFTTDQQLATYSRDAVSLTIKQAGWEKKLA